MRKFRTIFIIIVAMILVSCEPTKIDNIKNDKLSFDSLPDTVKSIYELEALKTKYYYNCNGDIHCISDGKGNIKFEQ